MHAPRLHGYPPNTMVFGCSLPLATAVRGPSWELATSHLQEKAQMGTPHNPTMVITSCCMAVFTLLVMALLRWWTWQSARRRMKGLPPGTMGWPLLGQTLEFVGTRFVTSLGEFMEKGCKRYGSVFSSYLFGRPTIISADAELNKFILANEDRLFECSFLVDSFGDIVGKRSILVAVGEAHKRMRSIAVRFLSPTRVKDVFFRDVQKYARLVSESWKEDEIISARDEAKKFLFYLLAKHILSFNPEEARTLEFMREYATFIAGMKGIPVNIPGTAYHRAIQARRKLIETLRREMTERKRQTDAVHNDFLDIAMGDGSLSTEDILDNVIALFFAGHHTPGAVLTYAIKFLADSPESVKELRAEHTQIQALKKGGAEELDWEDYELRMIFTQYVINETLRLAANHVHRKAVHDIKFKDYFIPKGWHVLPIFWAVHLDPCVYPDPLKFDPWRWKDMPKHTHFTPFGGGPRLCPGIDLIRVQISIFLHHLVLHYDWMMEDSDPPIAIPFVGRSNMHVICTNLQ